MTDTALIPLPVEVVYGEVVGNGLFLEENPFRVGRFRWIDVAEGATLAEYYQAAAAALPPAYAPHIELWIDEAPTSREHWARVKPKPGHTVYARVRPHGKGGKNILRAVLMIALIAAAVYFLGPGAFSATGWTGLGLTGAAAASASAAAIAVVTTVGMLAINALIPAPGLTGDNSTKDPKYQLTGSSNQLAPYRPVPRVFGKLRVYPVLAGHPYTEVVGNKQYLRMLLMVGWGPIAISDIRIGNTPINAFKNVETQISQGGPAGWGGNTDITLYNRKVTESSLSTELTSAGGASTPQTTAADTVEIGVDITFPFGLINIDKDGDRDPRTVVIKVEYRLGTSGSWLLAPLQSAYQDSVQSVNSGAGTISVTAKTVDMVRASGRFFVAAGTYQVRLTRVTADAVNNSDGPQNIDRCFWTTIRSFSTDAPVIQEGVALIAIRMQASDQLNGVPNRISCLAEAYVPVWNGSAWNYALSRSPAWAFADILRRRGGETYLPDSRIDYAGSIASWATDCAATAPNASEPRWTFDGVIEGGTVFDALRQIAAVGRAAYTMRDGKFAVVQDKQQATPVQLITPANSWGYRGTRTYLDMPHAYRVEFQNADADYVVDERIVYADGYNAGNAERFEVLQLYGCTSPTMAFREARYHMAVAQLRPEEHKVSMDIEALRCTLGDRVQLAYDVMVVGKTWGRIVALGTSGANTVSFTVDNECEFLTAQTYQLRVRHADGTISIRTVTMTGGPGNTTVLNCSAEATSGGPAVGDIYIFGRTGIETAPMIVKKIEPGDNLSATLTLTNYDDAIYTADTGTIPAFFSYIGTDVDNTPPLDPIVTVRADGTVHELANGNWILNRLGVDIYNGTSRVPVEGNEVQYRELYDLMWADSGAGLAPLSQTTIYCDPVLQGHAYQVRCRAKGVNGLYSAWVQPSDVVVIGSSVNPTPPTGVTVTPAYRSNIIRWTNPADLDLNYVEVLASQTNSSGTAVVVGRSIAGTFTHQNLVGGATWYYWLRAVDFAGNISTLTTSVSGVALTIALYEGIGSDSVLTPSEKLLIIKEWDVLGLEKAGIEAVATTLGITTEKTAYTTAYTTLETYLTGLSPAYNDTTQNTTIVRTTWNAYWESLYNARQTLLNKIDAVAATTANWPDITGPGLPDDNATGGDNYQPDPEFEGGAGAELGVHWDDGGSNWRVAIP